MRRDKVPCFCAKSAANVDAWKCFSANRFESNREHSLPTNTYHSLPRANIAVRHLGLRIRAQSRHSENRCYGISRPKADERRTRRTCHDLAFKMKRADSLAGRSPAPTRSAVSNHGKINEWLSRQDGASPVFLLNLSTLDEARMLMARLPLSVAGLMECDFIEFGPLRPLRLLLR